MRRLLVAIVLTGSLAGLPARAGSVDHYRQGLLLLERHEYQPALDEFRIAVIDQPTNPDALCGLGVALYKLHALREASEAFDRALAIPSSAQVQAQARSGLGDIYLQLGEHALAAAEYRTALSHNPQWIGARLNLARCLVALRQLDAAGSELARLLHEQPRLPEAYQVHSALAVARGDLPQAHLDLNRAWSLGKDLGETSLAQACMLACQAEDFAGAAALLDRYTGTRTAVYWATAGDTYYRWLLDIAPQQALGTDLPLARRMDADALVTLARAAYERALMFRPDQPAVRRALVVLGRLDGQSALHLLTAPGMGEQTLRDDWHLAAATALAAGDRVQALYLGRLAAEKGSTDDAARYERLLTITGQPVSAMLHHDAVQSPRGRYWLGEYARRRGDQAAARAAWAELPPGIWRHLADAEIAWQQGDTQTAWQTLTRVASLDPTETQTFSLAGEWANGAGDLGRALRAWQWGARLGLPDPWLLTGLARLYVHLDQTRAARDLCRQVLTILPSHAAAFDAFWADLLNTPWQPRQRTDTPTRAQNTEPPHRSAKA